MKKIKTGLTFMLLLLLSVQTFSAAAAEVPYHTYTYDYWEDVVNIPAPYTPEVTITGQGTEGGQFNNPQDLAVSENGKIFVADTGNNRIVVLDHSFNYLDVIESFDSEEGVETFNTPSGIFLSDKNELYIADTSNNRIVVLNEDYELVKTIRDPQSEILEDDFVFTPLKVVVDYADRVYVISNNMYQGIMTFDEQGQFNGFSGTINVSISFSQKVWRLLSTKEQRARQVLYIPTEFTGMDVDPDGFIYASNIDTLGEQAVRRLNPKGQDVIKQSPRNDLGGDARYPLRGAYSGPSTFRDVLYRENGVYSTLDSNRGRVFTYDDEGNLLYVFGGIGTQEGTFRRPVSLDQLGENLLVLDAGKNAILSFEPTYYGSLINQAVEQRYLGDETQTVALWEEVLKLDANNELAYIGIGKSYLSNGENKLAVDYLSRGRDRDYYSIAYRRYRNEIMESNFNLIMTTIFVGVLLVMVYRYLHKKYGFNLKDYLPDREKKKKSVAERREVNV